ncbi:MAG TPA: hypothetical protein PKN04_05555 [bacterium]|nr:hypothetical protein [bacterium]HNT65229.1 hypothetical protein [bacterium]HOX86968.1 hypothetical protein [bacterium]HPG46299.1 hypothetical protein [bacterium]HPM98507.1 hypothetical protein [bacterium]
MRTIGLLLLFSVLLVACDSEQLKKLGQDVQKNVQEVQKKADEVARVEREEYQKKLEAELEDLQVHLNDLRRQHGGRKTNPGYEVQPQIKDLEDKIAELRARQTELLENREKNWSVLKKRLDETLQETQNLIERLAD